MRVKDFVCGRAAQSPHAKIGLRVQHLGPGAKGDEVTTLTVQVPSSSAVDLQGFPHKHAGPAASDEEVASGLYKVLTGLRQEQQRLAWCVGLMFYSCLLVDSRRHPQSGRMFGQKLVSCVWGCWLS